MAGKTLADGYVELRADTSKLPRDVQQGIRSLNMARSGKEEGEKFGSRLATGAREKIKAGLGASLGALGIGVGIGAALTSGITGALDVGKANDKLRAQLNLTKDESGRLGKAAGELYSKGYGESMDEVNGAIASVVRSIPSLRTASVPVLKEISGQALDIARVFDQDVGGVTAAVSTMLKSGLAPNAKSAFDVLTKGFQTGADKGGDLLDTFTEYSVQFKKLGLDGPTSLGVINQLLAGGARNADLAADAVKEFSIRAIDGSKTSVAAYQVLGLNAKDMAQQIAAGGPTATKAFDTIVDKLNAIKDPVARNTAGVGLFGTKWEDLGSAIGKLDVSKAAGELGKVAGATKTLASDSDSSRIQGFIRSVQTGFVSIIGGQVIPVVKNFATAHREDLANALTTVTGIWNGTLLPALKTGAAILTGTVIPAISSVVGWMREHDTVVKAAAVTATALFAVYKVGSAVMAVQAAGGLVQYLASMKLVTTATKVWTGIQAALNLVLSLNPIALTVIAIGALVAAIVIAYKKSETFRDIVNAAWGAVKTAIKGVGDWFVNTLWPSLRRAYEQLAAGFGWLKDKVVGAWRAMKDGVSAGYNWLRDNVFAPLKNLITDTIPAAFRTGVSGIGKAWDAIKELAAKPVRFVVDTVINKALIGTFNKVSGFFGGPKASPVSLPAGFGDGPGHGPAPAGKGTGDGLGDMASIVSDPAKWIKGKVSGTIGKIGNHPFAQMLKGASGKLLDGVIDKAKSLIGLSESSGAMIRGVDGGAGGLQAGISGVLASLRAAFGNVPLISGFRANAHTLSGNVSYHASGRAIDISPVRSWAEFIHNAYGPQLKELITPWQDLNMHNGRPHTYTGAVWNQHNFPGGNAHIHAALDDGGMRMLRPGYNVIPNHTGGREPVAGPRAIAALMRASSLSPSAAALIGRSIGSPITAAIKRLDPGLPSMVPQFIRDGNVNFGIPIHIRGRPTGGPASGLGGGSAGGGYGGGGDTYTFHITIEGAIMTNSKQAEDLVVGAIKSARKKRRI